MRKSLVCLGLLVGLLGNAGPAWTFEYLSQPVFEGFQSVHATTRPVRLSESPPGPGWWLGAELRDSSCPTCEFPEFLLSGGPSSTPSFKFGPPGAPYHFVAGNDTRTIEAEVGDTSLGINQDTTLVPVSCQQELNTFLYSESVLSEEFQLAQLQGLARLRGLTARFAHRLRSEVQHGDTCPASLTLGTTMAGIKFFNPFTGTVLNYQIVTSDSRGFEFDWLWWSFQAANGETVYGVNDSVNVYGMGSLTVGVERIFSLNVLPRVRELIAENPVGLDKDPSHWVVRGFYSGTATHAQARIESTQRFFGLEGF